MKKVTIKKMDPRTGHTVLTLTTEEEVRNLEDTKTTVMILPDGRTCHSPDELLNMIQEDVYKNLKEIEVYQIPVLVGG